MVNNTQAIWNQILEASGGQDIKGRPLGADEKKAGFKILESQHKAVELQKQLNSTKAEWLSLLSENDQLDYVNKFEGVFKTKDWVYDNTNNLRVGVLQLTFANILFDIENQQTSLLKYIWFKMDSPKIKTNRFEIMTTQSNSYVQRGERFRANIFLAPVYQPTSDDIQITINGRRMPMENGATEYVCTTPKSGIMDYNVAAKYTDPATGEVISQMNKFQYTVGDGLVANVLADKMNVVYIGVDNPISISLPGVDMNNVKVSVGGGGGASIKKINNTNYRLRVTRPAPLGKECEIKVSAKTGSTQIEKVAKFRVKRIPNPVAKIGKSQSGAIGVGEFKAQAGAIAILENFDFDAKCIISGFVLIQIQKDGTRIEKINRGGRYTAESSSIIQNAKPGDIYLYDNVKAKCPGDPAGRKINSMVFRIK